jgi:hypothetical protein
VVERGWWPVRHGGEGCGGVVVLEHTCGCADATVVGEWRGMTIDSRADKIGRADMQVENWVDGLMLWPIKSGRTDVLSIALPLNNVLVYLPVVQ